MNVSQTTILSSSYEERWSAIQRQMEEFNRKMEESSLSPEALKMIYQKFTEELSSLTACVETARERAEYLKSKVPTVGTLWGMLALKTSLKVVELVGIYFSSFEEHSEEENRRNFALICGAWSLELILSAYKGFLNWDSKELAELASLASNYDRQLDDLHKFQLFLDRFYQIKRHEEGAGSGSEARASVESLFHPPSSDMTLVIDLSRPVVNLNRTDLDQSISDCLEAYANLPPALKNKDVYYRLLSNLIHDLPASDPLRAELAAFEPTVPVESNDPQLPTPPPRPPSMGIERTTSTPNLSCTAEQELIPILPARSGSTPQQFPTSHSEPYEGRLERVKNVIASRFNTPPAIPVLFTPNGHRIHLEHKITKKNSSEEPISSTQSSLQTQASPSGGSSPHANPPPGS